MENKMDIDDPKKYLTPLTSKLKEFSLNIAEESTWADDAEDNAKAETEAEEKHKADYERWLSTTHHVPFSGMRIPSSRRRSRRMLITPTMEDPIEVIEEKMREIALAVQAGENAALITDLNIGLPQIRDPTEHAKQSMKLLEREQYDAWEASQTIMVNINDFIHLTRNTNTNDNSSGGGSSSEIVNFPPPRQQFTLPDMIWEKDTTPLPEGKHTLRKFTKRASALATAYSLRDSSSCTPQHAVHFTLHHAKYLPLLRALSKVEHARRSITGDKETLSSLDMAEVQIMKLVNAIASRKVEEAYREVKDVAGRIVRCQRVLRERENEIKAGVEGYRLKNHGGVGTKMK